MAHYPDAPLWVSVNFTEGNSPAAPAPPAVISSMAMGGTDPAESGSSLSVRSSTPSRVPRSGAYARLPSSKDVTQMASAGSGSGAGAPRRLPRMATLTKLPKTNAGRDESSSVTSEGAASAPGSASEMDMSAVSSIDVTQLQVQFQDPRVRLGIGTYGSVYLGSYFGEPVAIKRIEMPPISRQVASQPGVMTARSTALAEFARQVRKYERVQHPAIVRFLGVAVLQDEHTALIVSEVMHGGSLAATLSELKKNKMRLHFATAVRVALKVCGALRALHFNGVVWGDPKPENILFSEPLDIERGELPESARACISDLGVASSVVKYLLADTTMSSATMSSVASYSYLSPEGFSPMNNNDLPAQQAMDIYALGSVLYEMLTLRTPWARCSMGAVYNSLVRDKKRPQWPQPGDADYVPDLPQQVRDLVEQCWAHRPEDRPTAQVMCDKLAECRGLFPEDPERCASSGALSDRPSTLRIKDNCTPHMLDKKDSSRSKSSDASTVVRLDASLDMVGSPYMLDAHRSNSASPTSSASHSDMSLEGDCIVPRVSPLTSPEPRSNGLITARLEEELRRATANHSAPVMRPDMPQTDFMSSGPAELCLARDKNAGPSTFLSPVTAPVLEPLTAPRHSGDRDGNTIGRSDSNQSGNELVQTIYRRRSNTSSVDVDADADADLAGFGAITLDLPQQQQQQSQHRSVGNTQTLRSAFEESASQQDLTRTNNLSGSVAGEDLSNFAEATARAAFKIEKKRSSQPDNLFATLSDNAAGIFGSVDPNASATAVATSLKRKRSTQIHAILERAGMAFLELQRRGELKNTMSPSMRRRAAERRSAEDAKVSEEDARAASVQKMVGHIELLRKEEQFSDIIELMEAHASTKAVAKAGVVALKEAAAMESHYLDICEEGAIDRLLTAVTHFGKNDVDLCTTVCEAITFLASWFTPKVEHHIRAAGIPSEVVSIMEYHSAATKLQCAGCEALAKIAASSELSRSAVATLGGPLAVYRTMTRNIASVKDVDLARAALKAIKNIANKNQRAAETFVEVAGLDSVSHAADVFADDGLEENILEALEAFAFYDGGRRTIITSNGLKALATLMLRKREPAFAERCCVLIRSVALWRDTRCEEAMLESAIAERTVMTIRLSDRIPSNTGSRLAFYSSQAVMYLASFGRQSRTRLRMTGAIDAVINLIRTRGDNSRVVTMATNALVELMKGDAEAQTEAERHGAIQVLLKAAQTFEKEPSVYEPVSLTLTCFAELKGDSLTPSDALYKYGAQARGSVQKLKAGGSDSAPKQKRRFFSGRKRT